MVGTRSKPPHETIQRKNPDHWNSSSKDVINITIECNTANNPNIPILFYYDIEYYVNGQISKDKSNLFFDINSDCRVNMQIGDSCKKFLRWSKTYYPITGKKRYRRYFGGVKFDKNSKTLSFAVKKRNASLKVFRFNLNFELFQGIGENSETLQKEKIWLPITLDPDVINPRPPSSAEVDILTRKRKFHFVDKLVNISGKEEHIKFLVRERL